MTAKEAIYARKACRKMLPDKQVPNELLKELLETAGRATSWSNSQPWEVFVVSGEKLQILKEYWTTEFNKGMPARRSDIPSPENEDWKDAPRCIENMIEWKEHRLEVMEMDNAQHGYHIFESVKNWYDAPTCIILGLHKSLGPYSYSDVGAYAQTFMIAACEEGVATMPAFTPCWFGDKLHEVLDIPNDIVLYYGIGVGYEDKDHIMNKPITCRMPIDKYVRFCE